MKSQASSGLWGLVLVSLTGCASLSGNAKYHYEKRPDGSCEVTISSGRELPGGAGMELSGDCGIKFISPSMEQGNSQVNMMLPIVEKLLEYSLGKALIPVPAEKVDDASQSDETAPR